MTPKEPTTDVDARDDTRVLDDATAETWASGSGPSTATEDEGFADDEEAPASGDEADAILRLVARGAERSLGALAAPEPDAAFEGSARYAVEARLGAGAFGAVYRVFDRTRGVRVALKRLRRPEPRWLLGFKEEFRALAGVVHPNLVTLFELSTEGDAPFFTMELVEGVDFLRWVRTEAEEGPRLSRLRAALEQLAVGVAHLHGAGKVHRDLKPSNVLVTAKGRVVILDFGLVADLRREGEARHVVGTPAYMAPEQAAGRPVREAADWYALGVMLYEALTGTLPFGGSSQEIVAAKQAQEPPRLSPPAAPADLAALCGALLARAPDARPDGRTVLAALSARDPSPEPRASSREVSLVGRVEESRRLDEAYLAARGSAGAWAVVEGGSGMGKSALVGAWLEGLRAREPDALVLAARCHEREAVPYKALDGVVDGLAAFLRARPPEIAARYWPSDGTDLVALFPVLGAGGRARIERGGDARERFLAASRTLRGLLARVREARPVVIVIDDLQWGDLDSVELLAGLVDAADAPPLCLVTCHRREEAESSEVVRGALALRARLRGLARVDVPIEGLRTEDARRLAESSLRAAPRGLLEAMLRDAAGSPYLLEELCRDEGRAEDERVAYEIIERTGGFVGDAAARTRLDGVLAARASRLPGAARRLLETVAVAGRPLRESLAFDAAGLLAMDPGTLARLRAERFLRARTGAEGELLECYHDRVREAVVGSLPSLERRACHAGLARAMRARGDADDEILGVHLRECGEGAEAAGCFERAALGAERALAFDRAARLYGDALALSAERPAVELRALRLRMADAVATAGRGAEAAALYESLAETTPPDERPILRRQVAEQLWRGGRIADGLQAASASVRRLGFGWPRGQLSLVARLVWQRARLALGLRRFTPGPLRADLEGARLDAAYFFSSFLSGLLPLRGLVLHAEGLAHALRVGDGPRVGRSLAIEAFHRAWRPRDHARIDALLARADALVADAPATIRAQTLAGRASVECARARFEACCDAAAEAERLFIHECVGHATEVALTRWLRHISLFYLGRWAALRDDYDTHRRDSEQRDDLLWLLVGESHFGWVAPLLRSDVAGVRAVAERMRALEPRIGVPMAHCSPLMVDALAHRLDGDGESSLAALDALWPALVRMGVRFVAAPEMRFILDHGSAALLAVARGGGPRFERLAERDAARLARLPLPMATHLAAMVRASLAALRGDDARAVELGERAAAGLDACAMGLHAAALRRRLGERIGGARGRALVEGADRALAAEGALEPARLAAFLVPGWSRP